MLVLTEPERKSRLDRVCFAPDGTGLAAGDGAGVSFWKLDAPNEARRFFATHDPFRRPFAIAFWDNDTLLASCGRAGLGVQALAPGAAPVYYPSTGHLVELAVVPRAGRVLGINHRFAPGLADHPHGTDSYQTWTTAPGRELQPDWCHEPHFIHQPYGLALLAGGRRFVSVEQWSGVAFVTHDITGANRSAPVNSLYPPNNHRADVPPLNHLTCSPAGEWIVAHWRTEIAVWAMGDLAQPPRIVSNDSKKEFTDLAFHPSGRYLAATCNDETVKFYDTATWEVARTYTWAVGKLRGVCFSADGALAAAGSHRGKVVVWDLDV